MLMRGFLLYIRKKENQPNEKNNLLIPFLHSFRFIRTEKTNDKNC